MTKTIHMTPDDWRCVADEAVEHAVAWLHVDGVGRSSHIVKAAELLSAADKLNGHANMMELMNVEKDTCLREE